MATTKNALTVEQQKTLEGIRKTSDLTNFGEEQVKLIMKTVAKGATFPELQTFLYICNKVGLDPIAKQIHFTKFRNKKGGTDITIITGIDGYRSIASKTGELAGIEDTVFDSEEKPKPKKATVTVYRIVKGEKVPFTASARWDEYFPSLASKQFMWNKMPYTMLGKCAEALALRKGFPNDLGSLRTDDEMDQAHTETKRVVNEVKEKKHVCMECGEEITSAVAKFSKRMTGKELCHECYVNIKNVKEGEVEEDGMGIVQEMIEENKEAKKVEEIPEKEPKTGLEKLKATANKIKNKQYER